MDEERPLEAPGEAPRGRAVPGMRALHRRCEVGDAAGVAALLAGGGCAVDAEDDDGATALFYAAMEGHRAVAEALLDAGADAAHEDLDSYTAVHHAAIHGHLGVLEALLARDAAALYIEDTRGYAPLHWTAIQGSPRAAALLLDSGAEPEATTLDGETPLHFAAGYGHLPVLEALVAACLADRAPPRRRAAVVAVSKDGFRPLDFAAMNGHTACVELLTRSCLPADAEAPAAEAPVAVAEESAAEEPAAEADDNDKENAAVPPEAPPSGKKKLFVTPPRLQPMPSPGPSPSTVPLPLPLPLQLDSPKVPTRGSPLSFATSSASSGRATGSLEHDLPMLALRLNTTDDVASLGSMQELPSMLSDVADVAGNDDSSTDIPVRDRTQSFSFYSGSRLALPVVASVDVDTSSSALPSEAGSDSGSPACLETLLEEEEPLPAPAVQQPPQRQQYVLSQPDGVIEVAEALVDEVVVEEIVHASPAKKPAPATPSAQLPVPVQLAFAAPVLPHHHPHLAHPMTPPATPPQMGHFPVSPISFVMRM